MFAGSKAAKKDRCLEDISDNSGNDDEFVFREDLDETKEEDDKELIAATMPVGRLDTTPVHKKKAPPKKATAAADAPLALDDLTNQMSPMSMKKKLTESNMFTFPWFCFNYKVNSGRDHTTVRFHSLCRPKRQSLMHSGSCTNSQP